MIVKKAEGKLWLPRVYAILDGGALRSAGLDLQTTAAAFREAGILLLQYRDKLSNEIDILANARAISAIFKGSGATLILNDFPHLAAVAEWDGVHVGQTDAAVSSARLQVGPDRLVGVSTHTHAQVYQAAATDADYIAYGPIFSTGSKTDAESPVGLRELREIRTMSPKPLVAIGGISRERMSDVFAAGADSIALIGALLQDPKAIRSTVSDLLMSAASAARNRA